MPPKRWRWTTTCCLPVVRVSDAGQGHGAARHRARQPLLQVGIGDKAQVDAVFAKAAHVTKLDLVNNRLIPNAMEPRAAIGSYNRATDEYTLYVSNQNPHVERLLMTAFVLGLPEHKVRVIAPDVGGGFGSKIFLYAEDVCLTWAAKQLNRSIKWTADRSEAFLSDAHGRDHVSHAEMAMDKDGKFLAMRVHTDANLGAYLSTFATRAHHPVRTLLAGQYTTPADLCGGGRLVHQHRAGGRLPRRRPPGGHLPAGAPGHPLRLGDGPGPGRDPQAQLHHAPSRTRRRWRCSTTWATTTPAWTRPRSWPTWPALSPQGRQRRPRA
jgi:hypothetical protein